MEIQCDCGKFRAELTHFPKATPGRLRCYCDDCQAYAHYLGRADILDENGGTEIIPIYPVDFKITRGQELLKCVRLHEKGMFRYSTTCCNTPIGNTEPGRAWIGTHRRMFLASGKLDQIFKSVRSSIMGKHAHGTPPAGTPDKFDFKGFKAVMPFMLKGMIFKRAKTSPFFKNGASIVPPHVLSKTEREAVLKKAGF